MKFILTSAKLTGSPDDSGWAQVHEFKPQELEKLNLRGHLIAVIATRRSPKFSLSQQGGIDVVLAGREVITRLHEEYFGEISMTPFNALREAVKKVTSEYRQEWGNLEISALANLGTVVNCVVNGGSQAVLFRKGTLAKILSNINEEETASASGYPQSGDLFVLGTKIFFEKVPEGILKASLNEGNPSLDVESLAPVVHSFAKTGSMAVAVIEFDDSKEEQGILTPQKTQRTNIFEKEKGNRFSKIFSQVLDIFPSKRIVIRRSEGTLEEDKDRKKMISVGVILLVLLSVSIFFGIRQRNIKITKAGYIERLTKADHEFAEALALAELNKSRARELLLDARKIISDLEASKIKDQEIISLKEKIESNINKILGEYRVSPEIYLDLNLASSGFKGDRVSFSDDTIYVFSGTSSKVVKVSFPSKETKVLGGEEAFSRVWDIAAYAERIFVLKDDGVYEVAPQKKKVLEKGWSGDVFLTAYAGNIYILEKDANTVWRYPGIGETFSSQTRWFGTGVSPDLSEITSWSIDGAVWLLKGNGRVLKFTLGKPDSFIISDLDPALSNGTRIYTDEELSSLYILDSELGRIVVLDKNGTYKAQYLSDNLKEATHLVASEKEKKIIFLSKDKLYWFEAKHLD